MRLIGFSTGAIALGDFGRALTLLSRTSIRAVELSALRMSELPRLIDALPELELSKFSYVSIHAPSRFSESEEEDVVNLLKKVPSQFPIIIHPDTIHDPSKWQEFGRQLAIENMDRRKDVGRSAKELAYWFEALQEARLCLDLAHVHQFDRTMTEAYRILRDFGDRICQVHMSELDSVGYHHPLSFGSMRAFSDVRMLIPLKAAIIVESLSPMRGSGDQKEIDWIELEIQRARETLRDTDIRSGSIDTANPIAIPS
jgi:endonuclease IV